MRSIMSVSVDILKTPWFSWVGKVLDLFVQALVPFHSLLFHEALDGEGAMHGVWMAGAGDPVDTTDGELEREKAAYKGAYINREDATVFVEEVTVLVRLVLDRSLDVAWKDNVLEPHRVKILVFQVLLVGDLLEIPE